MICDLAETYHIYDYRQLSPSKIAVFSFGLPDNARIRAKLSNQMVSLDTLLLAGINDSLATLVWMKTKDGQKGINRPASISAKLSGTDKQEKKEIVFESGEDFERLRRELLGSGGEN
ncbi:hypothetical protein IGI37_002256 [Enterococcus sp. AZ194]